MSNGHRTLVVPRTTGTHGDIFAAVGLADLLSDASDSPVFIHESPAGFEIAATLVDAIPQKPGYPFLKPNEKVEVPSGIVDFVDYKAEKAKTDRRKKLTQGKSKKYLGPEIEQLLEQDKPRPDWRLLQVLNTLQGDETSNRVYAQIVKMKPAEFSQAIAAGLDSLSTFEPSGLDWPATSVQLFSPNSAKGYSRLKPDSTATTRLKRIGRILSSNGSAIAATLPSPALSSMDRRRKTSGSYAPCPPVFPLAGLRKSAANSVKRGCSAGHRSSIAWLP